MPPLIALAGAIGGAALLRWAVRHVQHVIADVEHERRRQMFDRAADGAPSAIRTLRRDPASGAYRPE